MMCDVAGIVDLSQTRAVYVHEPSISTTITHTLAELGCMKFVWLIDLQPICFVFNIFRLQTKRAVGPLNLA